MKQKKKLPGKQKDMIPWKRMTSYLRRIRKRILKIRMQKLQKKLDRQIRCRQDLLKNLEMSRKLDRFMNAAMLTEEIE